MNEQITEFGMTEYDFYMWLMLNCRYWFIILVLLTGFIVLILKPEIAHNLNLFFSKIQAIIIPRKRKSYIRKNINNKLTKMLKNFNNSFPILSKKIIPYSLVVEWVECEEDVQIALNEKQAIIYVNDYKDERTQIVTILHNYMEKSFVPKIKYYNEDPINKSIDTVTVKKILSKSEPQILNYYNNEYVNETYVKSILHTEYYNYLKEIDNEGLFLPILINELNKYCSSVYPEEDDNNLIKSNIRDFIKFIHNIVKRNINGKSNMSYYKNGIKIRIILSVSDYRASDESINKIVESINYDISKNIETLYVLGAGSKIPHTENMTNKIEDHYVEYFDKPMISKYILPNRKIRNETTAICYEFNKLHIDKTL